MGNIVKSLNFNSRCNKEGIKGRCASKSKSSSEKHTKECSKTQGKKQCSTYYHSKKKKRQYRDFTDFVKRVSRLKLQNFWSIIEDEQDIEIYFIELEYLISKYQLYVDISLACSIQIYDWFLNDDHQL